MGIKTFSVLSLGILAWIILSTGYILVLYWVVFVTLVVFVNVNRHKTNVNFNKLNILFFVYLLFIAAIRIIPYTTSAFKRYLVNTIEHLLFSWVVGLILYIIIDILHLFRNKPVLYKAGVAAGLFYVLGIVNECYQNVAVGKPALLFDKGSYIDLAVNVVGALSFIAICVWSGMAERISPAGRQQVADPVA